MRLNLKLSLATGPGSPVPGIRSPEPVSNPSTKLFKLLWTERGQKPALCKATSPPDADQTSGVVKQFLLPFTFLLELPVVPASDENWANERGGRWDV